MKIAQELYEGIDVDGSGPVGLITYMRTDSLRVSDEAMHRRPRADQDRVSASATCPPSRSATPPASMAQEAHEAIRPTDLSLTPEQIKGAPDATTSSGSISSSTPGSSPAR